MLSRFRYAVPLLLPLLPSLLAAPGCHWLAPYPERPAPAPHVSSSVLDAAVDVSADLAPDLPPPDLAPPDLSSDLPPDIGADAAICSPTGVVTACDPFAETGCAVGSCYVIRQTGPACVCPAGELDQGAACMTTAQCAPGNVCHGDQPPGVCRRLCRPRTDGCGKWYVCTPITGLTDYGFCQPAYP